MSQEGTQPTYWIYFLNLTALVISRGGRDHETEWNFMTVTFLLMMIFAARIGQGGDMYVGDELDAVPIEGWVGLVVEGIDTSYLPRY